MKKRSRHYSDSAYLVSDLVVLTRLAHITFYIGSVVNPPALLHSVFFQDSKHRQCHRYLSSLLGDRLQLKARNSMHTVEV